MQHRWSMKIVNIGRRARKGENAGTSGLVFQNDVQSVDDTGDVTQDCKNDVDKEVSIATALEEDTDWWQEDGEEDLADVGSGERHDECLLDRIEKRERWIGSGVVE